MKLTLVKKTDEAKGIKSFFWQPEKPLDYLPGQYLYFGLPKLNFPDPRGATRHFTLSSSPTEGPILRFTTRIRDESGYKRTLDQLEIGSEIEGEGPNGEFILDDKDTGPHVFLAGGIGITPFRSMIENVVDKNLQTSIYLVYSNSIPEEITFRKELEEWSASHPNMKPLRPLKDGVPTESGSASFLPASSPRRGIRRGEIKVAMTITKPEETRKPWSGLTGRIDGQMIQELIENWKLDLPAQAGIGHSTWWVCGPPPMVDAMISVLSQMKIPDSRVLYEKFTGY